MKVVLIIILIVVILVLATKTYENNKMQTAGKDLKGKRVSEIFPVVFSTISEIDPYFHNHKIVAVNSIQDNLCSINYPNTIVMIYYYKNELNIEWKYQMFHQEVSRHFKHSIINFTVEQQRDFVINAFHEMQVIIREHQNKLTGI